MTRAKRIGLIVGAIAFCAVVGYWIVPRKWRCARLLSLRAHDLRTIGIVEALGIGGPYRSLGAGRYELVVTADCYDVRCEITVPATATGDRWDNRKSKCKGDRIYRSFSTGVMVPANLSGTRVKLAREGTVLHDGPPTARCESKGVCVASGED